MIPIDVPQIVYYLAMFLVMTGALFLLLGALGILRLPDVYNRLQAGTKATTLGAFGSIIGAGLLRPEWLPKAIIIAVFLLMTNPISSHALARASYRRGIKMWDRSVVDRYGPYLMEKKGGKK